jgi:hypothetical protein
MRIVKLTLFTVASALLVASLLPVAHATSNEEERFRAEVPAEDGWHGVNFDNSIKGWGLPSNILARLPGDSTINSNVAFCKTLEDSVCIKPGLILHVRALFDQCSSDADRDCIVSFGATKSDGTKLKGELKEVFASQSAYAGDPKQGIPDGAGASIWTLKDGNTSQDYALVAGLELRVNGAAESRAAGDDSRVSRVKMISALQPVELVNSPRYREVTQQVVDGINTGNASSIGECFVVANGRCALSQTFDTSINFDLTVRMSKGVPGWMVGRIQDFKLGSKTLPDQDGFEMTISGNPSKVGAVIAWSKWKDTTSEVRSLYAQGVDGYQWRPGKQVSEELLMQDGESRTILTYINEAGERSIKHFNAWLPLISDKATAMRTRWNLQTVEDRSGQYDQCSAGKGLVGVINSNASVYSDGPPTFNKATGTLEYKVAAPHYTSDGTTKHIGSYDLTMRSDVARCLYGFSDAPITATVAIESDGGTNIISTESVSERDGLIKLRASGFTFSSPTIKVRLSQAGTTPTPSATPSPSATPTPSQTPTLKKPTGSAAKKITCVKGKQNVKVSVTKGRCPAGFKKG